MMDKNISSRSFQKSADHLKDYLLNIKYENLVSMNTNC